MSAATCEQEHEVAGIPHRFCCELERGHDGKHRATIDDTAIDPDFTYVVSWWPTPQPAEVVEG